MTAEANESPKIAGASTVRRSKAHGAVFVLMALVTTAVELGLMTLLRASPEMWPVALGAHLGACAVVAVAALSRADDRDEHRLIQMLAATLPFFGALAPVALLAFYPLYLRFRITATPFAEWYRKLFPEDEGPLSTRLYQSIVRRELPRGDYTPVVSYMDIVQHGTVEQRIAVIATVARNFRPVFSPVLRAAIADDNPEVRVQAATAVAKLTDDFVGRMQALEIVLARAPQDPERVRKLAQAYDEYAYTGILDEALEQNNRLRALQLWLTYCEMVPDDNEATLAVGRLLMRLERHALAAQWLERSFAEGRATRQAVLWYMEVLYAQGRTDALRALAAQTVTDLAQDRTLSPRAVSAAQLWATGAASRPGPA
jgi:tetratricopeptide (TPR) repeat protein